MLFVLLKESASARGLHQVKRINVCHVFTLKRQEDYTDSVTRLQRIN